MWGHLHLPRVWVKKRIQIFTGVCCPGKVLLIILTILEQYPSRSYIQGKPKLLEFTKVWYDRVIKVTRVVNCHEKFDLEVVWLNCGWVVINCMWAENFENTAFFFQRLLFSGLLCKSRQFFFRSCDTFFRSRVKKSNHFEINFLTAVLTFFD